MPHDQEQHYESHNTIIILLRVYVYEYQKREVGFCRRCAREIFDRVALLPTRFHSTHNNIIIFHPAYPVSGLESGVWSLESGVWNLTLLADLRA